MRILFNLPTTISINKYKLDSFKVVMSDYSITLFLTTESIKKELDLELEPQGYIRNIPVTDVQGLFDGLEESNRYDYLVEKLTEGLDDPHDDEGNTVVNWDELKLKLNTNNIPSQVFINVIKSAMVGLDERVYINQAIAEVLIKKYGKKSRVNNIKSKGFARV